MNIFKVLINDLKNGAVVCREWHSWLLCNSTAETVVSSWGAMQSMEPQLTINLNFCIIGCKVKENTVTFQTFLAFIILFLLTRKGERECRERKEINIMRIISG